MPQDASRVTAREFLAKVNYEEFSEQAGTDLTQFATVSEMMDSILYLVLGALAVEQLVAVSASYHGRLQRRAA